MSRSPLLPSFGDPPPSYGGGAITTSGEAVATVPATQQGAEIRLAPVTHEMPHLEPNPVTLWWFWTLIGLAVLVILASVLLAIYFVGMVRETNDGKTSASQPASSGSNSAASSLLLRPSHDHNYNFDTVF